MARNGTNTFGALALASVGSAAVAVTETGDLLLDRVELGSGSLTLTSSSAGSANITQASGGFLFQTGPGPISLTAGSAAGNIALDSTENHILGSITTNSGGGTLTIDNRGDRTFTALAQFTEGLTLSAGGTVTLPSAALPFLASLTISARQTNVSGNITTSSGDIDFTGAVSFAAGLVGGRYGLDNRGHVRRGLPHPRWSQGNRHRQHYGHSPGPDAWVLQRPIPLSGFRRLRIAADRDSVAALPGNNRAKMGCQDENAMRTLPLALGGCTIPKRRANQWINGSGCCGRWCPADFPCVSKVLQLKCS